MGVANTILYGLGDIREANTVQAKVMTGIAIAQSTVEILRDFGVIKKG